MLDTSNGFKILVPYSAFDNTSYPPFQYVEGAIDFITLTGGKSLPDESNYIPFKTLFIQSKSSVSNTYFSQLDEDRKSFTIFSETLFELNNSRQSLNESNATVHNIDDEIKKYFKNHPHKLYDLNPRKFEELIASILKDLGFDVELTKATRDGGRDIIASIRNAVTSFLAYVECKRFAADNRVGVGIIRKVAGVHYIRKPSKSIIVTTSFFTKDAVTEAKSLENQLELKDFNDIKEWLRIY
jgi:HJR/Mrr/RecB family endonuclease